MLGLGRRDTWTTGCGVARGGMGPRSAQCRNGGGSGISTSSANGGWRENVPDSYSPHHSVVLASGCELCYLSRPTVVHDVAACSTWRPKTFDQVWLVRDKIWTDLDTFSADLGQLRQTSVELGRTWVKSVEIMTQPGRPPADASSVVFEQCRSHFAAHMRR